MESKKINEIKVNPKEVISPDHSNEIDITQLDLCDYCKSRLVAQFVKACRKYENEEINR